MIRLARPGTWSTSELLYRQNIYDPNHLTTIRVKSTSTKLEIFGTTTSGTGGVRLNAIELNAAVLGDYNRNGVVDGADYVIWRKTDGQTGVTPGTGADGNGDGDINSADYDFWRARLGNTAGSGSGSFVGAVPEPTTALAGFAGLAGDGRSGALSSFVAVLCFSQRRVGRMPSAVDPMLHCSGTAAS